MSRLLPLIGLLAVFAVASAGLTPRTLPPTSGVPQTQATQKDDPLSRRYTRASAIKYVPVSTPDQVRRFFPIVPLPERVIAPEGKLTIFADFALQSASGIPIYIVNRTDEVVELSQQDDDFYLKLEYESATGVWTRAQSHRYSRCGNSYHSTGLPPGQFVVTTGYQPSAGNLMNTRYRIGGGSRISNAGLAIACPTEAEAAARDEMAIRNGDFAFVRKVALGEIETSPDLRRNALYRLGSLKTDADKVREVLRTLTKDADKQISDEAKEQLKQN